jgi:hypothetical protein
VTGRRTTKRCPLVAHLMAPNGCCVGCGKQYRPNRPLTAAKARTILHHGKVSGRRLTPQQRKFFGARASGYPALSNPADRPERIGRARKFYYDRDQGNRQGAYFHTFTRRKAGTWTYPPGWAYFPNRVLVIR